MKNRYLVSIGVISLLAAGTAYAVPDSCDSGEGALVGSIGIDVSDTVMGGAGAKDWFGRSSVTGDFNGDGIDDLAIGADGVDDNGAGAGAVYVFFGPLSPGSVSPATADHVMFGEASAEFAGWSLANLGDYDEDGRDDLGVGTNPSRYSVTYQGRAYVVAGATIAAGAENNLAIAADAVLTGDTNEDAFGWAIGNAGDFNDDGFLDVVVGAPGVDGGAGANQGVAYVFYGPVSGALSASGADVAIAGATGASGFGTAVLGGLDVTGDGIGDLVIGSPVDDRAGSQAGATVVIAGSAAPASSIDSVLDATFTTVGLAGDRHGASLASAGDFNADGFDDYWSCSVQFGGAKKGKCYVFVGSLAAAGGQTTAEAALTAALIGEDANDLAGASIVSNFDVDQDGFVDVLIGGDRADGDVLQSGKAWLVYGPVVGEVNLTNADAFFLGGAYKDFAGAAVAAGDLNDDGYPDVVVGAWRANQGANQSGQIGITYGGADDADLATYYADTDLDGFGNLASTTTACAQPAGYSAKSTDCNDSSNLYFPGAAEGCADPDYNCDGFTGNADNDGDGFDACEECDDGNATVNPGEDEICGDDIDNDCDGFADDENAVDAILYCPDVDKDGFGDEAACISACSDPGIFLASVVNIGGDCDDSNELIGPSAAERCDLFDNDCDGDVDEPSAIDASVWYPDADGDTYGGYASFQYACSQPAAHVANSRDCDDSDAAIKPGASEVCDYADNDCDGMFYLGGPVSSTERRLRLDGAGNEQLGAAVTFLGDQNNDGFDEYVVGAPWNGEGASQAGAVYIRRGDEHGGQWNLGQLKPDGSGYWDIKITATRPGAYFGSDIRTGDFNGDGTADLAIGSYGARVPGVSQGAVYVFFGPIADGEYEAEDASFIIKGDATADEFGAGLGVGDFNGDGIDDLVAGAPAAESASSPLNKQGGVYVFLGGPTLVGEVRAGDANAKFYGTTEAEEAGRAVHSVGDLDGDGFDDLGIGAPLYGALDSGGVYIVYGAATFSGTLTANLLITGESGLDKLGLDIANVGDVNGDTYDDLLVGSDNTAAYLAWGSGTRFVGGGAATVFDYRFKGPVQSRAGQDVSGLGDVNADGYDDFLVSVHRDDTVADNAGGAYLVYGAASYDAYITAGIEISIDKIESFARIEGSTLFPTYSASNLNYLHGAKILGEAAGHQFGEAVGGGGDFNGDGYPDVAIGAQRIDAGPNSDSDGRGYMFLGGPFGTDDAASADPATMTTYFWDYDADTYVDEGLTTFDTCPLHLPTSFRQPNNPIPRGQETYTAPLDCDDVNYLIYPGATEVRGDGIDSDCDSFDNANYPPSVRVDILPHRPVSSNDLTASTIVTDQDGDAVNLSYAWYVNGALVSAATTEVLDSLNYNQGDTVRVEVLADDGRDIAGPFTDTETIGNSIPTLTACNISPAGGGMTTDWTAVAVGANDADNGDVVTISYEWQQLFGPLFAAIPAQTGSTLDSCADRNVPGNTYNCNRGNTIRVVCTPSDGQDEGIEYPSNTVTIANTPPVVDNCVINPSVADTTRDLTVIAAGSDLDGDTVTMSYVWIENSVDTVYTTTLYPSSETSHFENIQVRCRARDSAGDFGTAVTSTPVTISNTPPTAPSVDLGPAGATSLSDITATITAAATDIDGDPITYNYTWTEDGAPFLNASATVTAASLQRGEVWQVTATSHDGFVAGGSASDNLTIGNATPSVASVVLSPLNPTTADDIVATGVGWFDNDGDPEDYVVTWYVNGVAQATQTPDPMVLSNTRIVRDDNVYVTIRARDPFTTGNLVTSATLTVVNYAPTAPTLAVTPSTPGESSTLTCNVTVPSVDLDGDVVSYTFAFERSAPTATTVAGNTVLPGSTAYADVWYCTAVPNDGIENGDTGTSPTVTIQDLAAPPAPSIDAIARYQNEDTETLTGTCTTGINDCNVMTLTCNDGVASVGYNPVCSGSNDWSQTISMVRGRTTTCSLICTDIDANSSLASNTVTTEVCSPTDAYDEETLGATSYGDSSGDPVDEWAPLADNNAASITIQGNVVGGDTHDWYLVRTSDDPVADALAGINNFNFEIEMTVGAADYEMRVYRDNPAGAVQCAANAPYNNYSFEADDSDGGPNHSVPGNRRFCADYPGPGLPSDPWSLYDECTDLSADYFFRVERTAGTNCQAYTLRVYNGRP